LHRHTGVANTVDRALPSPKGRPSAPDSGLADADATGYCMVPGRGRCIVNLSAAATGAKQIVQSPPQVARDAVPAAETGGSKPCGFHPVGSLPVALR